MEEWKNIEGYEGKYLISNIGNIKSMYDNQMRPREKILKLRIGKAGYLYCNLWKGSKAKTVKPHRLVATHFLDNPNCLPAVNHKDGNKLNNNVENLEWCTFKYNTRHAIKIGLIKGMNFFETGEKNIMYGRHGEDNPCSRPVLQYDLEGNLIKRWVNVKEAKETLHITGIDRCCRGERKTARGFKWRYE